MSWIVKSRENKTPRSLAECKVEDPAATELYVWAEAVEKWGKVLFFVAIALGVIVAFSGAFPVDEWGERTFSFGRFLILIIYGAVAAAAEYVGAHTLALLLAAKASITRSTRISAKIAEYQAWCAQEEQERE